MSALDRRSASLRRAEQFTSELSRRRLVVLLAASACALATLAGCGGEKKLTRDSYDFPGARKDSTGNFQMRNAQ